jgi:ribosomal protein L34E
MPNPNKRLRKHKTLKTPSGKSTRLVKSKKTGKHVCALSRKPLNGMPHGKRVIEVSRLTKTQRRPENPLASFLAPTVRKDLYLQAVMLKYGIMDADEIDYRYKKYISMIENKIE